VAAVLAHAVNNAVAVAGSILPQPDSAALNASLLLGGLAVSGGACGWRVRGAP